MNNALKNACEFVRGNISHFLIKYLSSSIHVSYLPQEIKLTENNEP